MKYRIGSLTIEAIETYVRVTAENVGGPERDPVVRVTKRERPSATEVAQIVADIRGCWPDHAILSACSRAADDARSGNEVAL